MKAINQAELAQRITSEHRLFNRVAGTPGLDQHLEIAPCRGHC